MHGKIFGGYIMKKAFEIAYVSAVSSAASHLISCVCVCVYAKGTGSK